MVNGERENNILLTHHSPDRHLLISLQAVCPFFDSGRLLLSGSGKSSSGKYINGKVYHQSNK